MKIRQVVRVQILGAPREYTYCYHFDMETVPPNPPLGIGDKVELPPNQVQEEGSSGTVVGHGSEYTGEMKEILGRVKKKPNGDGGGDGLWEGFGQGAYK